MSLVSSVLVSFLRGASRAPLTSKRGPHNFYKGKGVRPTGRHTKRGAYLIDPEKILEMVVPDLTGFKLLPYVSHKAPKNFVRPVTVQDFLEQMRLENPAAVDLDTIARAAKDTKGLKEKKENKAKRERESQNQATAKLDS